MSELPDGHARPTTTTSIGELGAGGMGTVYLAEDLSTRALKV